MELDRRSALLLLTIPMLFLVAFFAVPFFVVALVSLRTSDGAWSLAQYAKLVSSWFYLDVLWFTFRIALWVTLASFLIGYPLAYYMTRVVKRRWIKRVLYIVVITPLFTSNIVRSFGWMILLGRRGLVNDSLMAMGLTEYPLQLLSNELSIVIGMTY